MPLFTSCCLALGLGLVSSGLGLGLVILVIVIVLEFGLVYITGMYRVGQKPGPLCFTACNFRNIKICIKFGINQSFYS